MSLFSDDDDDGDEIKRERPIEGWECVKCGCGNKDSYIQCSQCRTLKPVMNSIYTVERNESNIPWNSVGKFRAAVAIDFGTNGTAMALSLNNSAHIYQITDWNDNGICDSKDQGDKTKTALLLDENHQVIAFGNEAINKYMKKDEKDKSRWLLFEKFKMNLYDIDKCTDKNVNIKLELESDNKTCLKSEIVFIGALKYCKTIITKYIKNKDIYLNEKDTQWILTVPAIWSEHAKSLMKSWALKANLFDPNIDNQLLIALEPECASMNILMEIKDQQIKDVKFKMGDAYLILDLGAGTADMVCHEIIGEFSVKEIIGSSGGPWGSSYIDKRFEKILEEIFGKHLIDEFKLSHPKDFIELMRNFENSKQRFFFKQRKVSKHSVAIPFEFNEFMTSKFKQGLEELVSNYQFKNLSRCCSYDPELLSFSFEMWTNMFDELIDKIINHIQALISKHSVILKDKLKYLCLVGGFSQSPYLQKRINDQFESKYKIIIPNKPILSVIQGAAQLGRISSFIKSRIVNKTYGASAGWPIEYAKSSKISEDHIRENKYISDVDNKEWVRNCFKVFVNKGDEVKVNQMVEVDYSACSKNDTTFFLSIYSSEERDPGVITGCQKLGEIEIEYPEDFDRVNDFIKVRFYFGNTMIRVTVSTKGKEYEGVEINYDFNSGHV